MRTCFLFTAVLGLCSVLTGCETPAEERAKSVEFVEWYVRRIVYFKDTAPSPPLCYAYTPGKLTNVSCGPVEHLISAESIVSSK